MNGKSFFSCSAADGSEVLRPLDDIRADGAEREVIKQ